MTMSISLKNQLEHASGRLTLILPVDTFRALFLLQSEILPPVADDEEDEENRLLVQKSDVIASRWLPVFVNEPFVVAIIATFSTIFLQGKCLRTTVVNFDL